MKTFTREFGYLCAVPSVKINLEIDLMFRPHHITSAALFLYKQ